MNARGITGVSGSLNPNNVRLQITVNVDFVFDTHTVLRKQIDVRKSDYSGAFSLPQCEQRNKRHAHFVLTKFQVGFFQCAGRLSVNLASTIWFAEENASHNICLLLFMWRIANWRSEISIDTFTKGKRSFEPAQREAAMPASPSAFSTYPQKQSGLNLGTGMHFYGIASNK